MSDSARWDHVTLRPDDIIISTPPKCGTTWTQMICAMLVFQSTEFDLSLDILSPWVDMLTRDIASIVADLDAQTHRRFIKSHTPYDGLPHEPGVSFICVGRDPRDVFLSWDNHVANNDMVAMFTARFHAVGLDDIQDRLAEGPPERAEHEIDRFWEWIDDETPVTESMSFAALVHHLSSFWAIRHQPNVLMLRYEDLERDLAGAIRRIGAFLGIEVDEARVPEFVAAASFASMRARADVLAPESTSKLWYDNQQFFNTGASGAWHRLLDDEAVKRYRARLDELAAPDLAAWLHGES
jgi:hypothetical protein